MLEAMETVIAMLTAQQANDPALVVSLVDEACELDDERTFNVMLAMARMSGSLLAAAAENCGITEVDLLRRLAVGVQADPPPDSRG